MTGFEHRLGFPASTWYRKPGAAQGAIERLAAAAPARLPSHLLDLLRFSDGGEGALGAPACTFVLDSVREIVASLGEPLLLEQFPGFPFIGGNGAGERVALDLRGGLEPFPVVALDPIDNQGGAHRVADSFESFASALCEAARG